MRRIQRIALGLLLLISITAYAGLGPQEMIKSVAGQTIDRIKKDRAKIKANPLYINKLVDELILPHFDFERMSRWVLGKYWRRATPAQQQQFIKEFKNLLIRTYASSLLEYVDQKINYLPFRDEVGDKDVTVRSEIAQPGGFPIPITYKLYKPKDNWLVYDVLIDDVSLVANYRSSFSKEIRAKGMGALIKTLEDKNK